MSVVAVTSTAANCSEPGETAQSRRFRFRIAKKKSSMKTEKEERPADASKLSCGSLFKCASKNRRDPEKAPKEKDIKAGKNKNGTVLENGQLPLTNEEDFELVDIVGVCDGVSDNERICQANLASMEDIFEAGDSMLVSPSTPKAWCLTEISNQATTIVEEALSDAITAVEQIEVEEAVVQPAKQNDVSQERPMSLALLAGKERLPDNLEVIKEEKTTLFVKAKLTKKLSEGSHLVSSHNDDGGYRANYRQRAYSEQVQKNYQPVTIDEIRPRNGSFIDESTNREMWQNIVNKSLVGTTLLTKAALVNQETGGVFACNPVDFTPTVEQVQLLRSGVFDPGQLALSGIQVADNCFNYSSGSPGVCIFGNSETGDCGVVVYNTKTAILIGVFTEERADAAKSLVQDIAEYIKDQGL